MLQPLSQSSEAHLRHPKNPHQMTCKQKPCEGLMSFGRQECMAERHRLLAFCYSSPAFGP